MQLLKEQNEIAQGRATAAANETLREVEARKNIAIKKAESKRDAILQLIDVLNERIGTVEDWIKLSRRLGTQVKLLKRKIWLRAIYT